MSLPPAAVLPIVATTTDLTLLTGPFVLRGWALAETTGSAAVTAELYDGNDENDVLVAPLFLLSGTSSVLWAADSGIILRTGLFLEMLSGSIEGAIYYTPLTRADHREWALGEWDITHVRAGA